MRSHSAMSRLQPLAALLGGPAGKKIADFSVLGRSN